MPARSRAKGGRDEDTLAYLRDAPAWRNVLLVEQPNGDFAQTIIRHLLYSAFAHPYFESLSRSKDEMLAAIAAKAVKEMAYHVRHTGEWTIRLGDGSDESHRRAQHALDELWPYTGELFETDQVERALTEAGIAVDPASIRARWSKTLDRFRRGDADAAARRLHAERRPQRPPLASISAYPDRAAIPAAHLSGSEVVTTAATVVSGEEQLRAPGALRRPWSIRKSRC